MLCRQVLGAGPVGARLGSGGDRTMLCWRLGISCCSVLKKHSLGWSLETPGSVPCQCVPTNLIYSVGIHPWLVLCRTSTWQTSFDGVPLHTLLYSKMFFFLAADIDVQMVIFWGGYTLRSKGKQKLCWCGWTGIFATISCKNFPEELLNCKLSKSEFTLYSAQSLPKIHDVC